MILGLFVVLFCSTSTVHGNHATNVFAKVGKAVSHMYDCYNDTYFISQPPCLRKSPDFEQAHTAQAFEPDTHKRTFFSYIALPFVYAYTKIPLPSFATTKNTVASTPSIFTDYLYGLIHPDRIAKQQYEEDEKKRIQKFAQLHENIGEALFNNHVAGRKVAMKIARLKNLAQQSNAMREDISTKLNELQQAISLSEEASKSVDYEVKTLHHRVEEAIEKADTLKTSIASYATHVEQKITEVEHKREEFTKGRLKKETENLEKIKKLNEHLGSGKNQVGSNYRQMTMNEMLTQASKFGNQHLLATEK